MLNREYAVIDGKDSRDFGIYLIDGNIYDIPERDYSTIQIPGRTGDLIIDKERWKNIDVTYKFAAYNNGREKISAWLNYMRSKISYVRIETSLEPEIFRTGFLKDVSTPQIDMQGGGVVEVTFNCQPQKWLVSGDDWIALESNSEYWENPTLFVAEPEIRVILPDATSTYTITITDQVTHDWESVSLRGTTNVFEIDTPNKTVHSSATNYSQYVTSITAFPVLYTNKMLIAKTSGLIALIKAHWWKL